MVGREHKNVLRDIQQILTDLDKLKIEPVEYFVESSYKGGNGQQRPSYLLTKQGCELYGNRMTGIDGTDFSVKYIERFNGMENHIKQNQIDTTQLSPELQMFNQIFTAVANTQIKVQQQDLRIDHLEAEQERVTEVVSLKVDADWKNKANAILNRVAITLGGGDQYRKVRSDSYELLEKRAKCRLNVRLENLKKEAHARGIISPTKIKGFNKLDVIGNDARLTEIYLAIVKEVAIAHKVNPEGLGA